MNSEALNWCFNPTIYSSWHVRCTLDFWVYLNQSLTTVSWIENVLFFCPGLFTTDHLIFFFWPTAISSQFLEPLITHITIFKFTVCKPVIKLLVLDLQSNRKSEQKALSSLSCNDRSYNNPIYLFTIKSYLNRILSVLVLQESLSDSCWLFVPLS